VRSDEARGNREQNAGADADPSKYPHQDTGTVMMRYAQMFPARSEPVVQAMKQFR
jgi:hypothetical protein